MDQVTPTSFDISADTARDVRSLQRLLMAARVDSVAVAVPRDPEAGGTEQVCVYTEHGRVAEPGDPHGRLNVRMSGGDDRERGEIISVVERVARKLADELFADQAGDGCRVVLPGTDDLEVRAALYARFEEVPVHRLEAAYSAPLGDVYGDPEETRKGEIAAALDTLRDYGVTRLEVTMDGYGDQSSMGYHDVSPEGALRDLPLALEETLLEVLAWGGEEMLFDSPHTHWEDGDGGQVECVYDLAEGTFSAALHVNVEDAVPAAEVSGVSMAGDGEYMGQLRDAVRPLLAAGATEVSVALSGYGDESHLESVESKPSWDDLPITKDARLSIADDLGAVLDRVVSDAGHVGWEDDEGGWLNATLHLDADTLDYSLQGRTVRLADKADQERTRPLADFDDADRLMAAATASLRAIASANIAKVSVLLGANASRGGAARVMSSTLTQQEAAHPLLSGGARAALEKERLPPAAHGLLQHFLHDQDAPELLEDAQDRATMLVDVDFDGGAVQYRQITSPQSDNPSMRLTASAARQPASSLRSAP